MEEQKEKTAKKKSKKGLIIGLISGTVLAVAAGVVALVLNLNNTDPADPRAKIGYSNSFFVYDDSHYTLWNAEGERLNEDEYGSRTDFVNGYAYVSKDGKYGIVKDDGKMSVEFGRYGNITPKGGLYLAQDGNSKEYYLITGSGKELEHGEKLSVVSPNQTCGYAVVEGDEKIKVYNYDGKLIIELETADDADSPNMTSSSDFGLISYTDKNVLFDTRTGQALAAFEGSRYTFDGVSEDRKIVLMQNYSDSKKYRLYTNGKVYELEERKYYGITDRDHVIGYDNYSKLSLLDENYKVLKDVDTYLVLKDSYNYAVENEDGEAELYRNGELTKKFGEDSSIPSSGIMYDTDIVGVKEDGKVRFYRLDGSLAFNREYSTIKTQFNEFHHAVVSENNTDYYLIDMSGNHIGGDETTYKNIATYKEGYVFKNADDKYAIANKNGEAVTEFKYDDTYYRSNAAPRNIWTGRTGTNKYDIIDVNERKAILEGVNIKDFYANYFTIKNSDGKTEYYTYAGKLFYTSVK